MPRFAACSIGLLLALLLGSAVAAPKVGEAAPDVTLGVTQAGADAKVSDYAGKIVVVSFWATWCAPCRKELPILEGLQQQGKGNIQVIAVNIEKRDVFEKAAKLLAQLSLILANDRSERAQRTYAVKSIPHLIIFGRDGHILHIHDGYGDKELDVIVDEINQALAAKLPAAGDKT